jgi:hypothetical protein
MEKSVRYWKRSDRMESGEGKYYMRFEVFYFDGCVNHRLAVEQVQEVLREEGLEAEVVEIKASDRAAAQAFGFLGSPTVRVDGLDVEALARSSQAFGMTCRTYLDGSQRRAVPPRSLIREAVREAISKRDRNQTARNLGGE